MNLADAIADDWMVFDSVETVTVTGPDGDAQAGVKALRLPVSRKDMQVAAAAGIELQSEDTVFELFVSTLGSVAMGRGATIAAADGATYYALLASNETLKTRWHCPCRKNPGTGPTPP